MLIPITKQVTTEELIEVSLPFFSVDSKYGSFKTYYAIHENSSFCVMLGDRAAYVSVSDNPDKINEAVKYEPITEMDFDFAYQMALERLTKAVHPTKETV